MHEQDAIRADWAEAAEIAANFPNKKCLEAAAAIAKKFGADATILFVNTAPYALRPFIVHESMPGDIISETGLHFAVELHGRVFDNLTPAGASREKWARAFGFATRQFEDASFADIEIAEWTYLKFQAYLKSVNRTPLGKPRRSLTKRTPDRKGRA